MDSSSTGHPNNGEFVQRQGRNPLKVATWVRVPDSLPSAVRLAAKTLASEARYRWFESITGGQLYCNGPVAHRTRAERYGRSGRWFNSTQALQSFDRVAQLERSAAVRRQRPLVRAQPRLPISSKWGFTITPNSTGVQRAIFQAVIGGFNPRRRDQFFGPKHNGPGLSSCDGASPTKKISGVRSSPPRYQPWDACRDGAVLAF